MRSTLLIVAVSACFSVTCLACSGAPSDATGSTTGAVDDEAVATNPTSLPDPQLTPGAVLTTDVQTICAPGYSGNTRNVSSSEKRQVAEEYNYTGPGSGVEYDHLISLELGGSNDVTNLWPQPIAEAHVKDRLEDYLHKQVCAGNMSLQDAQQRISSDWIQLWKDLGEP